VSELPLTKQFTLFTCPVKFYLSEFICHLFYCYCNVEVLSVRDAAASRSV
jgi:hypothetical protein